MTNNTHQATINNNNTNIIIDRFAILKIYIENDELKNVYKNKIDEHNISHIV